MTRLGARGKAGLFDYWTLTKPEVNLLIVITTLQVLACLATPALVGRSTLQHRRGNHARR